MLLWANPYVRQSCEFALAPAASLAVTAFRVYSQNYEMYERWCHEFEILPGLCVDTAIKTCLSELRERSPSGSYSEELLRLLEAYRHNHEEEDGLWLNLSINRRASAALAITAYLMENGTKDQVLSGDPMFNPYEERSVPLSALKTLLQSACGAKGRGGNAQVRKEVWQAAAAMKGWDPNHTEITLTAEVTFTFSFAPRYQTKISSSWTWWKGSKPGRGSRIRRKVMKATWQRCKRRKNAWRWLVVRPYKKNTRN